MRRITKFLPISAKQTVEGNKDDHVTGLNKSGNLLAKQADKSKMESYYCEADKSKIYNSSYWQDLLEQDKIR